MISTIHDLVLHPDSRPGLLDAIKVEIEPLPTGGLCLIFQLSGDLTHLRLPEDRPASRADDLWRHTCCEAFIRTAGASTYREFNFSPSSQWQAYAFTAYRAGGLLEPAADPNIEWMMSSKQLRLLATLQAADLPPGPRWQVGLSAVIESSDGDLGYWALRHPPGKPDFHHPDSFAVELELT